MNQAQLPALKNWSNDLENSWSQEGRRQVNIDVGVCELGQASSGYLPKDHAHRLYLGQGIYGEVTLHYVSGEFRPLALDYPDYTSLSYRKMFGTIRELHRLQLRTLQQ